MMAIVLLILAGMFIACLHQANQLCGKAPKRLILGLILMMVSTVALFIATMRMHIDVIPYLLVPMLMGIMLWLFSERRINQGVVKL
jgi:hypothetical protein